MKYIQKFINIFSTLFLRMRCNFSRVKLGKNVIFKKYPSVFTVKSASISIGNNTLINSNNYGYHINMHSPCKLYADRPNSKIVIGENCRIHGTCIHSFNSIIIGDNVLIAANSQIIDGNAHELSFPNVENRVKTFDNGKPIVISDNVWIGANCYILGGVTIGEGAVVSANSVIHKDVPPMSIAGGNPFKIIKQY